MGDTQKDFYDFIRSSNKLKEDHHEIDSVLERDFSLWYYHAPEPGLLRELSGERYEGKECKSSLILFPAPQNIDNLLSGENSIRFDNSEERFIKEDNFRLIRKQLEAVSESDYLAAAYTMDRVRNIYGYRVIGIVSRTDERLRNEEYFEVRFHGALKWSMSIHCKDDQVIPLFGYNKGVYQNYDGIDKEIDVVLNLATENDIIKYFFCSIDNNRDNIIKIMKEVLKTKHGTSFIIINDDIEIQNESRRFCDHKRGELLNPTVNLCDRTEKLEGFSKVDGGMILSVDGQCYAYGVIFDGFIPYNNYGTKYIGTHERGSRFNSMRLYIANADFPCLGVVFSEDGGIDIIGKNGAYNTKKGYFTY